MTQTKQTQNRILQNLWKKLLVFALTFCLGLISLQVVKYKTEPLESKIVSKSAILNESATSSPKISEDSISLFEECVRKFKKAVAENDKETVATLIHFPIVVGFTDEKDGPQLKEIKNSDEFLANYDKIFDDSFKKCINEMKSDKIDYQSRYEASNYSAVKMGRSIYSFRIGMNGYKINDKAVEVKISNIFRGFIIYTSKNRAIQRLF